MDNIIKLHENFPNKYSEMKTLELKRGDMEEWVVPEFQRNLHITSKVKEVAEQLKSDPCLKGIITLGRLPKDPNLYLMDGQHRREAFYISGLKETIADIRIMYFDTMKEMAKEARLLQGQLARTTPEDVLHGMEGYTPNLQRIRKSCPFVGYYHVRRGPSSPIISMSVVIRFWESSSFESPCSSVANAAALVEKMHPEEIDHLIVFLTICHVAWGEDPEFHKLWGGLNLLLSMWLYRMLVIDTERAGSKRFSVLTKDQFKKCLMAMTNNPDYCDWFLGKHVNEQNRSPGYTRIRRLFLHSLKEQGATNIKLPNPRWWNNKGGR